MRVMAVDLCVTAALGDKPPRRPRVEFASVPPSQWSIHDRLLNWSKWARGSEKQSGVAGSPMFNLYRSSEAKRAYGEETTVPVDQEDAMRLAKAVGHLPPQKRKATHWYYLEGGRHPAGMAREMGVEVQRLSDLVRDARTVLIGWVG